MLIFNHSRLAIMIFDSYIRSAVFYTKLLMLRASSVMMPETIHVVKCACEPDSVPSARA